MVIENVENIPSIADFAMKDISKRVAKLMVANSSLPSLQNSEICTLFANVFGDYSLIIALTASREFFYGATQNMMRGEPPTENDITVYMPEFFNILCGHIVTTINKTMGTSARFGVPRFIEGFFNSAAPCNTTPAAELAYSSCFGFAILRIYCSPEI